MAFQRSVNASTEAGSARSSRLGPDAVGTRHRRQVQPAGPDAVGTRHRRPGPVRGAGADGGGGAPCGQSEGGFASDTGMAAGDDDVPAGQIDAVEGLFSGGGRVNPEPRGAAESCDRPFVCEWCQRETVKANRPVRVTCAVGGGREHRAGRSRSGAPAAGAYFDSTRPTGSEPASRSWQARCQAWSSSRKWVER